jgi:putative transposase
VSGRAYVTTTTRDEKAKPAPDLVDRQFEATAPNQLWVSDITSVPTWAGFLFLAVVIDAWSRKVVGWAMATHLKTELVINALDMAVAQRQPTGVVAHSDQGCQYTSVAYGQRCREAGVQPSMGTVGDAYDNAMCESFFASLEKELIDRRTFRSHPEGRMAVFRYIEGWYNTRRRHSGIDYYSPNNYELKHKKAA